MLGWGLSPPSLWPESPSQVWQMTISSNMHDDPGETTRTKVRQAKVGGKGQEREGKTHAKRHGRHTQRATHKCKRENKRVNGKSHEINCSQTDNKPHQTGTSSSSDADACRIFGSPHPFPHSPFQGKVHKYKAQSVHNMRTTKLQE